MSQLEVCEQTALLALQALERCCRQCKGDGMHLAADGFFRNTVPLVPRLAAACPSVLSTAVNFLSGFAKDGPYYLIVRHLIAVENCSPCIGVVVEQTMTSLVHVAIVSNDPLDSLSDT